MSIEKPFYTVIQKEHNIEIRTYQPYISPLR